MHLRRVPFARNALAVRLREHPSDVRNELAALVLEEANPDKTPVVFRPLDGQDSSIAVDATEVHAAGQREVMFDTKERAKRCLNEAAQAKVVSITVVAVRSTS